MGKTVSQLTPEELKQYDPTRNLKQGLDPERWARAQAALPKILELLREQFGVERVRVFGSLIDKDRYTRWSDVDIAVWGLAPEQYYRAVEAVNDLAEDIKVDVIDFPRCHSLTLKQIIEEEGIDL